MADLTELQRLAEPTRWHELKTDPDVFDAVADGRKTHEIRFNDRDFRVGDGLLLRRTRDTGWAMKNTGAPLAYTGEELRRVVSHVLQGPVYGLADGWAILSFAAMHPDTAKKLIAVAEALELVLDCSSQEWQQADGKRMAATDNQGRRFWFITEDVMQAARTALEELKHG